MNIDKFVDKLREDRIRIPVLICMRISELLLLAMAVYIAYSSYQYHNGWYDAINATKAHQAIQNAPINLSGVPPCKMVV